MHRMNKNWIFVPLMVLALALSACQAQAVQTPAPAALETDLVKDVIVQGRIEPMNSLDLAFGVSGRIAEVLVEQGETIKAGQVLARLGGSEARKADLARAMQEIAAADQAIQDLNDAGRLNQAQAALAVVEKQKEVDRLQESLDDLKAQFKPDEKQVEEAEVRLRLAQTQLVEAREYEDKLENGVDPELLAAARIRLDTALAVKTSAQAALDALELRAPIGGQLVSWDAQVGQVVNAGQVLGTVMDASAWLVRTDDLTEIDVVRVYEGEGARIVLDALPGQQMSAKVTHIAERFEEKRGDVTYTVTLLIDDPVETMRWGMTGQITFLENR